MGKATSAQRGFSQGEQSEEQATQAKEPAAGPRLTDSGRAAYERAVRAGGPSPRRLEDLSDGEYGFRLVGDDGSEGLALLSVLGGRMQLDLPLDEAPFARIVLPMPVGGLVTVELERGEGEERLRMTARGELVMRPQSLSLDLRLSGIVESGGQRRLLRRRLKGSADLRFGLA